jgi:hypothetical protein
MQVDTHGFSEVKFVLNLFPGCIGLVGLRKPVAISRCLGPSLLTGGGRRRDQSRAPRASFGSRVENERGSGCPCPDAKKGSSRTGRLDH